MTIIETESRPDAIHAAIICLEEKESMDNNKNRAKDRPKSNPERRKMKPKENSDVGIINGQKIGLHDSGQEKTMEDKK